SRSGACLRSRPGARETSGASRGEVPLPAAPARLRGAPAGPPALISVPKTAAGGFQQGARGACLRTQPRRCMMRKATETITGPTVLVAGAMLAALLPALVG